VAKQDVMRVFVRVSPEARPSAIDLAPVERHYGLSEPLALTPDLKDLSVYFFELPGQTDLKVARALLNDLEDQASVDEVWHCTTTYRAPARAADGTRKEEPGTRITIPALPEP